MMRCTVFVIRSCLMPGRFGMELLKIWISSGSLWWRQEMGFAVIIEDVNTADYRPGRFQSDSFEVHSSPTIRLHSVL
jgi:hypothetical protein